LLVTKTRVTDLLPSIGIDVGAACCQRISIRILGDALLRFDFLTAGQIRVIAGKLTMWKLIDGGS
jgi:hypothetical protein